MPSRAVGADVPATSAERLPDADNVRFVDQHPGQGNSRRELLQGLLRDDKWISPKFLYDQRGSELFEEITTLPEYYPTRTERSILSQYAQQMHEACGDDCVVIEPGSGSSEKIRLLLDALRPAAYVPLDISADFLRQSAQRLGSDYEWLQVWAICTDFSHDWQVPADLPEGRRVVFYPGSTIGNLEPPAARAFLRDMREWMSAGGGALVGVDLHKDSATLNAAYNDAGGITAAFNRNLLAHVNRILGADFQADRFRHHAFYDTRSRRIEMHLVSNGAQRVDLGGPVIELADGESIHTENSYKYTPEQFGELCASAGLQVEQRWSDPQDLFSVFYLSRS
jgi:dimethylhistidine N-methyltransferase